MSQLNKLEQVATFDADLEVSETVISLLDQGGQKTAERKDENAKYNRKFKSFVAGLIGSRYDWSYCLVFFAVAISVIIVGRALGSHVPYPDELVNETQDDMISAKDPLIDAVSTSVTSMTMLASTLNPMVKLMQKELPPEEVGSNKIKTVYPTHFTTSVPAQTTTISHDDLQQTEDYITN